MAHKHVADPTTLERLLRLAEAKASTFPVLLLYGRSSASLQHAVKELLAVYYGGSYVNEAATRSTMLQEDDLLWIPRDPEEHSISIDTAKALSEHLAISPFTSCRTVVLEDVDALSLGAANSLLKIIEEPPPAARIILTTQRLRAVLPTIRSRAMAWPISMISAELQVGPSATSPSAAASMNEWQPLVALLLQADTPVKAIPIAEELAKTHKVTPKELILEAERTLSMLYRQAIVNGGGSKDLLRSQLVGNNRGASRRQALLRAHQLVGRARINLNTQMVAESLAGLGVCNTSLGAR